MVMYVLYGWVMCACARFDRWWVVGRWETDVERRVRAGAGKGREGKKERRKKN